MKTLLRARRSLILCLTVGLGLFIAFSIPALAQVTVSNPQILDATDFTTPGAWQNNGFGECFYLIPGGGNEEFVGPDFFGPDASGVNGVNEDQYKIPYLDPNGELNICVGAAVDALFPANIDWRIYRDGAEPGLAFSASPSPADDIQGIAKQDPGCFPGNVITMGPRGTTWDDGDLFTGVGILPPMASELKVNYKGPLTLAYYFVNGEAPTITLNNASKKVEECRTQDFILSVFPSVGGPVTRTGTVGEFSMGKYLVFELDGLEGETLLRFETAPSAQDLCSPVLGTRCTPGNFPNCDYAPAENDVLSGVFISDCEPPPDCSIGDFVFEDANRDGCQDPDERPIEGVEVTLFTYEDCDENPTGTQVTTTNDEGFYEFTGLDCGKEYRVQFGNAGDIYDYTEFESCLDEPGNPDTNDPANDSDCNGDDNGFSGCVTFPDPVNNPDNPTIDCGYVCEGKIGDFVWLDFNGTPGCQDPEEPGIDGVIVNLFEVDGCPDVQGQDPFMTTTTVNEGEYLFEGLCPGDYRVTFEDPLGRDNTVVDQSCEGFPPFPPPDTKDSDCGGDGECVTLTKDTPEDPTIDCGKVPPCELAIEKFCSVPPPPSADLECDAKIAATTLRYIGPDISNATVVFSGNNKKADGGVTYNVDLVSGVTVLTSAAENGFTIDERPEDLGSKMTISIDDVEEVIHTSCSTPYVAGQPAPLDNPKGEPSPNWFVVNFVDKEGNFSGIPDSDPPDLAELCEVVGVKPGSCEDGKPTSLTFIYTGDDCTASDNEQGDKAKCEGDPAGAQPVQVVYTGKKADKFTVTPADQSINVGDSVTITTTDKFEANTKLEVRQGGRSLQDLEIHTSCSQPLAVGDQFGSLLLSQFVPQGGAAVTENVLYTYRIRNNGVTAVTVDVVDDQLGPIAENLEIPAEGQVELTEGALLSETTTNIVTVTEVGDPNCFAEDSVKVTVEEPPVPPGSCEDGKPVELTFRYTGDGCGASNNNQGDKAKCEGDPAGAQPVQVVYTGKKADKFTVTPADESIMVDDAVTITTTDKFEANTKLEVRQGGRSLQDLEIHTSCSQPLAVGDQFGSLILEAFVPKP